MSYPKTQQLGGRAFNHEQDPSVEKEYDRLRDLAREEHGKYQHCSSEAQKAYKQGDGGRAHQMSTEGKQHAQKADDYNKQASEYIFRENNAVGKVPADTIDLHGQFVEEAEQIVEQRIRYAQSTGQKHLHVIVGKGNHSVNHIQKIKPRVEQVCQELGLQYHTEQNEGRMYVDLTGGNAQPPQNYQQGQGQYGQGQQGKYGQGQQGQYGQEQQGQYTQQQYGQPHYQTAYPMGGQPQYNATSGAQQMDYEEMAKKAMPIIQRLLRSCCTVM